MNRKEHSVRQPADPEDRRVRRTTQLLTHALMGLVQEKRYDAITIQDLLDRADIGRSTFYSHYRGKDDLLLKSFVRMLDMLDQGIDRSREKYPRALPVKELFRHVGEFRRFHQRLVRAHMLDRVYQVGTDYMRETLARRLAARTGGGEVPAVPLEVVAQAYAGALFALLRWWLDHDQPYPPERMDEIFHSMLPEFSGGPE